jgi:hypothetical protein
MSTKQEPYNFYLLDTPNRFVFECTPFDVSSNLLIEPGFINYLDYYSKGFTDVSQVATLDISPSMINNMFIFNQTTSITEVPFNVFNSNSMLYGIVNTSYNFSFSQANSSKGLVKNDYIKAINYDIAHTDIIIFKNTTIVEDSIQQLDAVFNLKIKQNISNNISTHQSSLQAENQSIYAYSCKQLISGILTYSSVERISQFWDDINKQTPPYSVVFHPGDSIAMRIGYVPKNGNGSILEGLVNTKNNKLYTRTYKIILNVK